MTARRHHSPLRLLSVRVRRVAAIIAGLAGILGCGGSNDQARRVDTARGTVGADTAAATQSTPPRSELSFEVDANDVAAALQWDSTTNTATYPIVAGLTASNSAWNFNGHARGSMTIVVPVGARVVMPFSNLDANVPHSFGIIAGEPNIATLAAASEREPVFPGAISRRYLTGIRSTETDIVRFTANTAGEYLLVCGVPGHAPGGMWIRFVVSADAKRPEIRINE